MKILIGSVILAIKINSSINSVEETNSFLSTFHDLPLSWRSKNYAFEFIDCINYILNRDLFEEIRRSSFQCIIIRASFCHLL